MTSIQIKNHNLQLQFTKFAQDPYIQKCVGEMQIPICFVEMLEELLAADTTSSQTRNYIWSAAAILLQMGLELHTLISTESKPNPVEMKRRQRYVLAGDYYSSLFYYLLADHQEIEGVQYFSQVIGSINQDKLSWHQKRLEQHTYDHEMIQNLKSITSGLLMAVADFFHVQEEFLKQWKKAASLYLFVDYIERSEEWHRFSSATCHQIGQEWSQLREELNRLHPQDGRRLLRLLDQKNHFVYSLFAKGS